MDSLKPLKLQKWETQGIKIHWSDGHISQYRSAGDLAEFGHDRGRGRTAGCDPGARRARDLA